MVFKRLRLSRRVKMIAVVVVAIVLVLTLIVIPLIFSYMIGIAGLPRVTDVETPANYAMNYRNFTVVTSDGVSIKGWFIPSSNNATIIMIHGGAVGVSKGFAGVIPGGELRFSLLPIAKFLHEAGYNVILYDRRLNGESGNGPSFRAVEDLYAIVEYIKSNSSLDPKRIGLFGPSGGGWTAIMAAGESNDLFRAVVAEAPMPHLNEGGRWFELTYGLPSFPFYSLFLAWGGFLTGTKLDDVSSYHYVDKISPSAFFIIADAKDGMFSQASMVRLYSLAGEPKYIWKDVDAAHAEAYFRYPEEYERRVVAFYDTYLLDLPRQGQISG